MINREMRTVTLKTYGGVDDYGQMLTEVQSEQSIQMTFQLYSHSSTDDVRYQNITHTGLTLADVNDTQTVTVDGKEYKISFVNDFGRLK